MLLGHSLERSCVSISARFSLLDSRDSRALAFCCFLPEMNEGSGFRHGRKVAHAVAPIETLLLTLKCSTAGQASQVAHGGNVCRSTSYDE